MKFPHFLLVLFIIALAVAPFYWWQAHERDEAASVARLAQIEQDLAQAQQDIGQMKQQLLLLKRRHPDD